MVIFLILLKQMLHNTLSTTGSSTLNSEKDRYLLILDEAMRIFLNKENADIEKVIEFLDSTVEIIPHIEVSYFKKKHHTIFLSLHPLCGGGDLLFLLSPPAAAATCFCSHSKTPSRIISKYLQYAYWPCGICLVNFFFAFFSFFSKIQDGRQNPMALATA